MSDDAGVTRPSLLPPLPMLRRLIAQVIVDAEEQGHAVDGMTARLDAAPDSYDALLGVAEQVADLPLRPDWPYDEPDSEGALARVLPPVPPQPYDAVDVTARVRTSVLARVAGCVLGKPFESDPTLEEMRGWLEPHGEWPLSDYVSEAAHAGLPRPQPQWAQLVRERITHVAEDDDLAYTALAMTLLERHGRRFTAADVRRLWHYELPVRATFGPERVQLVAVAVAALLGDESLDGPGWGELLNPTAEWCGALIRADAYGWACPGDPAAAAVLARRDAWVTHRRTGVYAAGFVAAAVAAALVCDPQDRLLPLEVGLAQVPPQSRLAAALRTSLEAVSGATSWLEGYDRVHSHFARYTHCRVYQELGTLAVTLRFAESVGHGIGLQVCMGNDTDSFGATAGALLGALLGPDSFDEARWVAPFQDTLHLPLAMHHDTSLERFAQRAAGLAAARP
ncbi:MAG: hypothetical protein QOK42_50 [Frankiaceae bacterium]|nr:hypothetical protein [Frankiaceae bacterium]